MELEEAIANLNADTEEMAEKECERRDLKKEYDVHWAACRKRIEYPLVPQDSREHQ